MDYFQAVVFYRESRTCKCHGYVNGVWKDTYCNVPKMFAKTYDLKFELSSLTEAKQKKCFCQKHEFHCGGYGCINEVRRRLLEKFLCKRFG